MSIAVALRDVLTPLQDYTESGQYEPEEYRIATFVAGMTTKCHQLATILIMFHRRLLVHFVTNVCPNLESQEIFVDYRRSGKELSRIQNCLTQLCKSHGPH